MTRALALILISLAAPATAHPGHLIELGGHDHWIAGIAIGVAIGAAIWGAVRGKKPEAEIEDEQAEVDGEAQEA